MQCKSPIRVSGTAPEGHTSQVLLALHADLPVQLTTSSLYACSIQKAHRPLHCSQTDFCDAKEQEG